MYYLKKDGETIFKHPVESVVYGHLLEVQPSSSRHALTHEGYSIEHEETRHEKEFRELAEKIGVEVGPTDFGLKNRDELMEKAKEDRHLNNIPLKRFDQAAYMFMAMNPKLVRENRIALADMVSAYKQSLLRYLNQ